ncbi:MAG: hydantoinase B/oxoprolinase family protein [Rubrivivax sp.]
MQSSTPKRRIDPARFEVVKNALYSTAEEMKIIVAKTAFSPLLKLAGDYSCGVFDTRGNMVAQGPDLPGHLGSMPDAVRAIIAAFPEPVEGDVYIHNDPYTGGSHLPDVNVATPAFKDGRLLGYCCVRAHWPDIGSATPGSYGVVTEIYGEGLRIPPVRLMEAGTLNRQVDALIFSNIRAPDERRGDLRAQIAANARGAARLAGLAVKYGVDELLEIMQEVMDYSERLMRAALSTMPDGEATVAELLDGDGIIESGQANDEPIRVQVKVTKRGDRVIVDFEGSAAQVAGPMNAPLSVTAAGVFVPLKMVADPGSTIPPNSGCWRAVEIRAPKGTVVNAQAPAAVVYANHEVQQRVGELVMAAFARINPANAMASSQSTAGVCTFGGKDWRSGEDYISYEVTRGGFGARPMKDGINGIASMCGNMMNTPVEVIEMSFPLRVEEYTLIPDSGGAGKYRGGLSVRRIWRVLRNGARVSVCAERGVTPAPGLEGGLPGSCTRVSYVTSDGRRTFVNTKTSFTLPAEGCLVMEMPGAGGYGPPSERDPEALRQDLLDGYVTPEAAEKLYGRSAAALLANR